MEFLFGKLLYKLHQIRYNYPLPLKYGTLNKKEIIKQNTIGDNNIDNKKYYYHI